MVQASEIKDRETLKAWLDARPEATRQRDAVIIAHRAAMRVLPFFVQSLDERWAQKHDLTALPVLRPNLTSGATVGNPAPEVKRASSAASSAADSVGDSAAASSASFAAYSAYSASASAASASSASAAYSVAASSAASSASAASSSAASSAAWAQFRSDAAKLETSANPEQSALWPDAPEALQRAWDKARDWLTTHPGHEFWIRWYEAALEGRPLTGDWESHDKLLTDIALIPEEDWQQGAEHVAGLIAEIEAHYRPTEAAELAAALPMAETIAVNPATGLFHTVPIALQNAPLIGSVLARVQDALEDARLGHNGITETSREFRVVTRVATRYANDPQQIEVEFTALAQGLRRQFDGEEVPRNEDTLALLAALEEGVRAIRATHPEVEANRRLLARQVIGELSSEDQQFLAVEATEALVAITDTSLGEDLAEAITEMLAPRLPGARRYDLGGKSPALPGEVRLFSRAAKIALSSQLGDVILKIDSSPGYKGARIATTIAALVTLGVKIFGVI